MVVQGRRRKAIDGRAHWGSRKRWRRREGEVVVIRACQVLETWRRGRMEVVGRWERVSSRSSGVERTLAAAQWGLEQVCWGMYWCGFSGVVGSGSDGLRLVMCEVSLGMGSGLGGCWSDMARIDGYEDMLVLGDIVDSN
jgi:hypothetical protein